MDLHEWMYGGEFRSEMSDAPLASYKVEVHNHFTKKLIVEEEQDSM